MWTRNIHKSKYNEVCNSGLRNHKFDHTIYTLIQITWTNGDILLSLILVRGHFWSFLMSAARWTNNHGAKKIRAVPVVEAKGKL